MIGLLKLLFLDRRARAALAPARPQARPARPVAPHPAPSPAPPPERTAAQALAEAEERMRRLPPEKAQLIRTALLVHRARQTTFAELDDDQRAKLATIARNALMGRGQ